MTNDIIRIIKANKKLLLILLTLIFVSVCSFFYENKVFYIAFVDEQDNLVLGHYLLHGEKLYSNLFSHHQPMGYILSSLIQELTHPNSLYLLIKRHREFMILWSGLWTLVLVLRFGLRAFFFSLIYEPIKIFILGNLFLSEALVVYPLVYLASSIFVKSVKYESLFIGFCLSLTFFLLAPIWPLVLFLGFYYLYINRNKKREALHLIVGSLPLIIISIYFSSLQTYIYNVFYINFKYYIPLTSPESFPIAAVKAFFTPLISFLPATQSTMLWIIRVLSLLLLITFALLLRRKEYKLIGISLLILWLSNVRFVQPGLEIYNGFHLLPWFALLIVVLSFLSYELIQKKERSKKVILSFLIIVPIVLSFYFGTKLLFTLRDKQTDQYINYSSAYDYGQAVRVMKNSKDTLFVIPDFWLIYWQADIKHASYMVNYYPWMSNVPSIKKEVADVLNKKYPTFLYCESCISNDYKQYEPIIKSGKETKLFVLKKKVKNLSSKQISDLNYLDFSFNK